MVFMLIANMQHLVLGQETEIPRQEINAEKSHVNFQISNLKFRTVKGTFTEMQGELSFDEEDLSICSFNVCVNANTVNTSNKKRDKHLKKEDFFNVVEYPQICFESNSITQSEGGFKTVGLLKMLGVEKEVEIPFTFDGDTFVGNFEINRLDFKLGEQTGTGMVGDKTAIEIKCVLN